MWGEHMKNKRLIDASAFLKRLSDRQIKIAGYTEKIEEWLILEKVILELKDFPTIDPETLRPESEWELNPYRFSCEHFRCKKCHHIDCVADKYCGERGSKMKNAGVKPEDMPIPTETIQKNNTSPEWTAL